MGKGKGRMDYPSISIGIKIFLEKICNVFLQELQHRVALPVYHLQTHLRQLYSCLTGERRRYVQANWFTIKERWKMIYIFTINLTIYCKTWVWTTLQTSCSLPWRQSFKVSADWSMTKKDVPKSKLFEKKRKLFVYICLGMKVKVWLESYWRSHLEKGF